MKKSFALLLAIVMLFSLAACNDTTTKESAEPSPEVTSEASPEVTPEASPEVAGFTILEDGGIRGMVDFGSASPVEVTMYINGNTFSIAFEYAEFGEYVKLTGTIGDGEFIIESDSTASGIGSMLISYIYDQLYLPYIGEYPDAAGGGDEDKIVLPDLIGMTFYIAEWKLNDMVQPVMTIGYDKDNFVIAYAVTFNDSASESLIVGTIADGKLSITDTDSPVAEESIDTLQAFYEAALAAGDTLKSGVESVEIFGGNSSDCTVYFDAENWCAMIYLADLDEHILFCGGIEGGALGLTLDTSGMLGETLLPAIQGIYDANK